MFNYDMHNIIIHAHNYYTYDIVTVLNSAKLNHYYVY